jgi:hypothetical protein
MISTTGKTSGDQKMEQLARTVDHLIRSSRYLCSFWDTDAFVVYTEIKSGLIASENISRTGILVNKKTFCSLISDPTLGTF